MSKRIKKLNSQEIAFICSQFSVILNTGVALHDGMELFAQEMKENAGEEIIKEISRVLNDEKPLFVAMESTNVFPDYVIKMVKIGEMTGRLDEVLDNLAQYYDSETRIRKNLVDAVCQPLIILVLMFAVVCTLVIKIIPSFSKIFEQFSPRIGQAVNNAISLSKTVGNVALIVLAIVITVSVIIVILCTAFRDNKKVAKFLSIIPGISSVMDKYAMTRFVNAMNLMVKSGVDSTDSLEYVMELNTNPKLGKKLKECHEKVARFEPFAQVIADADIFTGVYKQMIKISYKTGAYEQAWDKINKKYSEELDDKLQKILSLIEPTLVGVISVIVGTVLISVMLPLMTVMSSIG